MGDNSFPIHVWSGLIEAKHVKAMGSAVWEYLWCLDRQTTPEGLVLGGKPVQLRDIGKVLGRHDNIVSGNLSKLASKDYITTKRMPYGLKIRVLKAKKYRRKRITETSESEHEKRITETSESLKPVNHRKQGITETSECRSDMTVSGSGREPPAAKKKPPQVVPQPKPCGWCANPTGEAETIQYAMQIYHDGYQQKLDACIIYTKGDFGRVKELASKLKDFEELLMLMARWFDDWVSFGADCGYSVGGFVACVNKLRAKRTKPKYLTTEDLLRMSEEADDERERDNEAAGPIHGLLSVIEGDEANDRPMDGDVGPRSL